jgi:hypothetical protein
MEKDTMSAPQSTACLPTPNNLSYVHIARMWLVQDSTSVLHGVLPQHKEANE